MNTYTTDEAFRASDDLEVGLPIGRTSGQAVREAFGADPSVTLTSPGNCSVKRLTGYSILFKQLTRGARISYAKIFQSIVYDIGNLGTFYVKKAPFINQPNQRGDEIAPIPSIPMIFTRRCIVIFCTCPRDLKHTVCLKKLPLGQLGELLLVRLYISMAIVFFFLSLYESSLRIISIDGAHACVSSNGRRPRLGCVAFTFFDVKSVRGKRLLDAE